MQSRPEPTTPARSSPPAPPSAGGSTTKVDWATARPIYPPVQVVGLESGTVDIEATYKSTCALLGDGTARCWGDNDFGQLGDGTTKKGHTPVPVIGVADAAVMSAGDRHGCVGLADGGAKCWGWNGGGRLGDGTTKQRLTAVDVVGLEAGVEQIDAGHAQTCAVLVDSSARCWGQNDTGQLGDGTTTSRHVPTPVDGLGEGVTAITTGGSHSCAISPEDLAMCWGGNSSSELGDRTALQRVVPTLVAPKPAPARRVLTRSAGMNHGCWIGRAGAVSCVGDGRSGQLGNGTLESSILPVKVVGLPGPARALAGGESHTCALVGGGAWCWGSNWKGALGDGTTTTRSTAVPVVGLGSGVQLIAAGDDFTCAALGDGSARCWGWNQSGQLGDGTTTDKLIPVQVSGLTSGVTSLELGNWHSCAVVAGSAKCWGGNLAGAIGDGTQQWRLTPVQVVGLKDGVASVAAGDFHSCAVRTDGSALCWGQNETGELGDGTTEDRLVPVPVSGLSSGVMELSAGHGHTCAALDPGDVKCWGANQFGQLGNELGGTELTPVDVVGLRTEARSVVAGQQYACAVLVDDRIACWGSNDYGQLGDVTRIDRFSAFTLRNEQ